MDSRVQKAQKNIITSLSFQLISIICGLIVPQILLNTFGSEIYGATISITQFLAYISLLQGGVGGVARAALYRPLAERNSVDINGIMTEMRKFFRVVALIFLVYSIILAALYKSISDFDALNWFSTFFLVITISASTFFQYFFGITNSVFLQANQKNYILNVLDLIAIIINTIAVIFLVKFGCGIIIVKLVSSFIYILKPVFLYFYVKKTANISYDKNPNKVYLKQKWTGLGQHLAFFLHSNTDVALLTIFSDLKFVSIYAVYSMVTTHMKNFITSFVSDLEAIYGSLLACGEYSKLKKIFDYYDTFMSLLSGIIFSVTAIMISSFVKLYTQNVNDANYIVPSFAILLIFAEYLYCLRLPYHNLVIAAGHFKETKFAAYGEAVINVVVSIFLVQHYQLVGVAIGTVIAVIYRFIFYIIYLSKRIIERPKILSFKRLLINIFTLFFNWIIGMNIIKIFNINTYVDWVLCSIIIVFFVCIVAFLINYIFYYDDFLKILSMLIEKYRGITKRFRKE